ncbi:MULTISPECIES: DUF6858 family protein [Ectothiorhodospira]|uniref:Uncharacterized protein n=1 Tax=Ectothiorhodospira marina TaxID=1396821 RepID=A0A1H7R7N6_9GAMM|nr:MULTISPECIES: hypothetical protein [Ectothiorhodospira]MCG5515610.1 hypothetical protein [Ectothiorhodospira sp. 9100]MCG5518866.1 hypothetical protein [Ectothiorhodospira sp. 9905]SEL56203.1 hypothetical protein SAMN05444515_1219 [Ectothiorhodospira marina]
MKQTLFQEKYPVFYFEVNKSETTFQSVPEILAYFKEKVDAHPVAQYIGEFDHYSHTKQFEDGEIAPEILDAQHILFCFGVKLPTPRAMAVRPRSIGVCEMADRFVIDFLEAPMPLANNAMEEWTKAVCNK